MVDPRIAAVALVAALAGTSSEATPLIYPGCAVPGAGSGVSWHFDAVAGDDSAGDGSAAHPWRTLQAVVAKPLLASVPYWHALPDGSWGWGTDPTAPIHPGDTLLLASGDYGSLSIGVWGQMIANSDFVIVQATPGSSPLLHSLTIGATNKWLFSGIKVMSPASSYSPLVSVGGQSAALASSDIVLDNLDISSTDSVQGWLQSDWLARARWAGVSASNLSSCTSVSHSSLRNLRNGVALLGDKALFSHNRLDYLGDDFIDYAANSVTIEWNWMTNSLTLGDGNHQDFIQGQIGVLAPGASFSRFRDIAIDHNTAISQTDPALPFPGPIQGINNFNSDLTNLTITNNVVINNAGACQGIGATSAHTALIENNVVIDDGRVSNPHCSQWISVGSRSSDGLPSDTVAVRNNVAPQYSIDLTIPGSEFQRNICNSATCTMAITTATGTAWNRSPGVYGDGNIIMGK